MNKIKDRSLYLVITEEYCNGRGALKVAEDAIRGGVDIIQMREKNKSFAELAELGKKLAALCKKSGATFIVNDDPVLAKEADADGVHLGQEDAKKFPLLKARRILGPDRIIGISTHSPGQFRKANGRDFDYIAYGPIFETKTKDYFLGTGHIREIVKISKKPVFFIGGIDLSNLDKVLGEGANNIALIRGIAAAEDIGSKAKEYKSRIMRSRGMVTKNEYKDKR